MCPVDEIDVFLLVFTDGGIQHYNEGAAIGFSEEISEAPASPNVDIAPKNASVSHRDGRLTGIHFSHRFCPFKLLPYWK